MGTGCGISNALKAYLWKNLIFIKLIRKYEKSILGGQMAGKKLNQEKAPGRWGCKLTRRRDEAGDIPTLWTIFSDCPWPTGRTSGDHHYPCDLGAAARGANLDIKRDRH
jgi:hypothetical protein